MDSESEYFELDCLTGNMYSILPSKNVSSFFITCIVFFRNISTYILLKFEIPVENKN